MKIMNFLIMILLLIFAGCKPSDFSTLTAPTNSFVGRVNFQHEKVPGVSCMQCHEGSRPVYVAPLLPHGNGADCNTCHTSAVNAQGVRSWHNLSHYSHVPVPTSCLHCHDATTKPKTPPHLAGQWGDGQDCVSCHTYPKWTVAKFDHNKPLTTCIDCHQIAKDARPTGVIKTLHPTRYYENLGTYYSAIITGDSTVLTAQSKTIAFTSPLTSSQDTIYYRLRNISLITQTDSMQMDCILCHTNNTNTQDPSNSLVANPTSKKWTNTLLSGANSSVTFTYTDHSPTPTSCVGCHEVQRPSNHIVANAMNDAMPGMDAGDCQGCHSLAPNLGTGRPPVVSDWRDYVVAFNHAGDSTATPPRPEVSSCIGCHKNSIPANQKPLTVTATPKHPVATGTYYKIDCVQCHTYVDTRTPPSALSPTRSWANIYFSYKTHTYDDGVQAPFVPTSCNTCHKTGNDSRPNALTSTTHTKGSRLHNDCATCHLFDATNKWKRLQLPWVAGHSILDATPNADRCDSCHNANVPLLSSIPKLSTTKIHIPVKAGNDCNTCHTGVALHPTGPTWKQPDIAYIHSASDSCSSCHKLANPSNLQMPDVSQFDDKHFPIGSMQCSQCHTAANTTVAGVSYKTWNGVTFSHANTGGAKCATCHNDPNFGDRVVGGSPITGTVTKQLPLPLGSAHLNFQAGNDCNVCHISTTSFTGLTSVALNVTYTHNLALDNDCNSCHRDGASGTGFATGTAASAPAYTHMTVPYLVSNGATTTTKVQCSTCHQDVNGLGVGTFIKTAPDFKIHTSANTKLTTTSLVDTRCNVCHDGTAATAKTINDFNGPHTAGTQTLIVHPSLGSLQCVTCHQASLTTTPNRYKDFTGGAFVHTASLTNNNTSCNTCHGGTTPIATSITDYSSLTGRTGLHVPSTKECVFCHTASVSASFVSFVNGNYDHSDGVNCKTCHADSTLDVITSFGPTQKTAAAAHGTQNTTLTAIHTGTGTAAACNTCHTSYATWTVHTTTATTTDTTCNSCHTGLANTYGLQASSYTNHVPITGFECKTCHQASITNTAPKYKDFSGAVYTHTGTETCTSCHTATTTVIHSTKMGTPGYADCKSCHVVDFAANPLSWKIHIDSITVAKNTNNKTSCNTCHLDATSSAILQILKNISMNSTYNHFSIYKNGGASAATECATCHQASMTDTATTTWAGFNAKSFAGGALHANISATGALPIITITNSCLSCHNPTYFSSTYPGPGTVSSSGVTVTGVGTKFTTTLSVGGTIIIQGVTKTIASITSDTVLTTTSAFSTTAAGSSYTTSPSAFFRKMPAAPSLHINTSVSCDTCHKDTTFAAWKGMVLNSPATSVVKYTHNDATDGTCNTCHTGAAGFAEGTSTYKNTAGTSSIHMSTTAQCSTCHQGTTDGVTLTNKYTDFIIHSDISTAIDTRCNICHDNSIAPGGVAIGKTTASFVAVPGFATHPIFNAATKQCVDCHQSSLATDPKFTSFAGGNAHDATPESTNNWGECNKCHLSDAGAIQNINNNPNFHHISTQAASGTYTVASTGLKYIECVVCHSGSIVRDSLNANPITNVQIAKSFKAFTGGKLHSLAATSGIGVTACASCHNASFSSGTTFTAVGTASQAGTTVTGSSTAFSSTMIGSQLKFANGVNAGLITAYTSANSITVSISQTVAAQAYTLAPSFRKLPTSHLTLRAPVGATTDAECSTCHAVTNNDSNAANLWTGMAITNSLNGSVALNVTYTHADGDKGNCITCHTGATAFAEGTSATPGSTHLILPKTTTTSGINVNCDTCHSISVAPAAIRAQWRGMAVSATTATVNNPIDVTYNHLTVGTATCKSCHFDSTGGAAVPRGMAVGTAFAIRSPFIGVADRVDHIVTNASDCKGCHLIAVSGGTSTVWNASNTVSVTKTTAAYESFFGGTAQDHSSTTTDCISCHWDAGTLKIKNAIKTTNLATYKHIDITSGSTVVQCSVCHQASMVGGNATTPFVFPSATGFGGGVFHANATASGLSATTCNTCHNSGTLSYEQTSGVFKKLPTEGTNHLTRTATGTECSVCHAVTNNSTSAVNSWKGMLSNSANPVLVAYTHNLTNDSTCKNCHNADTTLTTYVNKSGFATGYTNTTVHTTNATVECSTCHKVVSGTTTAAKLTPNFKIHDSTNTTNNTKCNICHLATQTVTGSAAQTGTTITGTGFSAGMVGSQFTFANGVTSGAITAFNSATSLSVTTAQTVLSQTYTIKGITKFNNFANTGFVHFPINNGTTSAECYTCHSASLPVSPAAGFADFTGGLFHTNSVTSGVPTTLCVTCHKATGTGYAGKTVASVTSVISGKETPATHLTLPASATTTYAADCKTCHVTTTFDANGWKGTVYNSTGTAGVYTATPAAKVTYAHNINVTSDADCISCHDATKANGYATGKTAGVTVHGTAAGTQECSVCHLLVSGTGAASTAAVKTTTDFKIHDSTNITATKNRCNVCHLTTATSSATVASTKFYDASGAYTHIPIKTTATAATYAECSICHQFSITNGTTAPATAPFIKNYSFASAKFHSNVTASAAINTTCATCHNSASYTYEKVAGVFKKLPAMHLTLFQPITSATTTSECSACHKVTNNSTTATNVWAGMATANAVSPTTVALNVTYKHTSADILSTSACSTCHDGTKASGYAEGTNAVALHPHAPAYTHLTVPAGTECIACHLVSTLGTDSWKTWTASVPQVVYTAHSTGAFATAGTRCDSCHTGTSGNTLGFAKGTASDTTAGGHPSTTGFDCSGCHSASSTVAGISTYTSFSSPLPKDHRAPVNGVGGSNCLTCHLSNTGTITNFTLSNKTAATYSHFPILNASSTAVSCAVCHTASLTTFADFTGGLLHTNATAANVTLTANCNTCHTSFGKLATAVSGTTLTVSQLGNTITGVGTNFTSAMVGSQFVFANGVKAGLITAFNSITSLTVNISQTVTSQSCTTAQSCYIIASFRKLPTTHFTPPTATNCDSCHNITTDLTWTGMPLRGSSTTVTYDHLTMGTATCTSCHAGTSSSIGLAEGPANVASFYAGNNAHLTIPAGNDCNTCHQSKTVWTGIKSIPALVTYTHTTADQTSCLACHTGSTDSVPAEHGGAIGLNYFPIIYPATGTITVSGTAVSGSLTNFNTFPIGGAILQTGTSNSGTISTITSATSITTAASMTTIASGAAYSAVHLPTNGGDCSGCHAITVTGGTAKNGTATKVVAPYESFYGGLAADHRAGANCITCHWNTTTSTLNNISHATTGYTHFNMKQGTTPVQCSICHAASQGVTRNYDNWTGGVFHSVNIVANINPVLAVTNCNSCHLDTTTTPSSIVADFAPDWTPWVQPTLISVNTTASALPITTVPGLTNLNLHVDVGTTQCSVCHTGTTYTNFSGGIYHHATTNTYIPIDGTTYHGKETSCSNCHTNVATTKNSKSNVNFSNYSPSGTPYQADTVNACGACHLLAYNKKHGTTGGTTIATKYLDCISCHGDHDYVSFASKFSGDPVAPQVAGFGYAAPAVASVSPTSGDSAGGTTITITGSGFRTGVTATVGGSVCTSPALVGASPSTQMTCRTPLHAAGVVNIVVTNSDTQSGTLTGGYTYVYTNPAPTIGAFSPLAPSGNTAGGTSFTITGTGFDNIAGTVSVGGSNCVISAISSTSITCTTTAHALGLVGVTVTNGDTQSVTAASAYNYVYVWGAPTVTAVSPVAGPASGGTSVTITGTNFYANPTVTFGGTACTGVSLGSAAPSTTITCTTPLHAAGAVSVLVTNTDTRVNAANTLYTYAAAPTITSVSPTNGIMAGNTLITITGANFESATTATVNNITCTPFATALATPAGTVSVTSTGSTTPTNLRKIVTGSLTNFAAAFVAGDKVLIGTDTTQYTIAATPAITNTSMTLTAAVGTTQTGVKIRRVVTTYKCYTPASVTSGAMDVTVTNTSDGQTGTLTSGYTYNPRPVITSISPTRGATAGGTILTVNGTNFDSTATVQVGTAACTAAPAIVGTVFTTSGNVLTGSANSNFLSSIAVGDTISVPNSTTTVAKIVSAITDTTLTMAGTAYSTSVASKPTVGGAITKTASSTTSRLCVTPAGAAGLADVIITNVKLNGVTDGQTGTLAASYLYAAAPTVSSVSPNFKDVLGGGTITILGANFQTGATAAVKIDTAGTKVSCTSVSVVDSSHITCIAPAHAAGAVDIQVTNADGQSGTLASAITYNAAPVVTSISPVGGPLAGGNTLTINGTFDTVGTNSVTVGGASCAVITSSATQITCTLLGASAGAASVVVTNSLYGQNSVNQPTYLYSNAPSFTSITPAIQDISGAHTVTITGNDFHTGATVSFISSVGGATIGSCTSVTLDATTPSTKLTCISPASLIAQTADLVITNTDTQSVTTSTGVFTYQVLAAPVLVTPITETKNTVAATGAHNINLPTGIIAGDTLIVCYEALAGGTLSAAGGWLPLGTSSTTKAKCVYTIATGSEGATVSFSSSTSSTFAAHAMRITGANATAPIDVTPAWNSTTSTTTKTVITTPINSGSTNSLYLQVFFASSTSAATTVAFSNTGTTATAIAGASITGSAAIGYTNVAAAKEIMATASKTIQAFGVSGAATTATYSTGTISSKASVSIIVSP